MVASGAVLFALPSVTATHPTDCSPDSATTATCCGVVACALANVVCDQTSCQGTGFHTSALGISAGNGELFPYNNVCSFSTDDSCMTNGPTVDQCVEVDALTETTTITDAWADGAAGCPDDTNPIQ